MNDFERAFLRSALERAGGDRKEAALEQVGRTAGCCGRLWK